MDLSRRNFMMVGVTSMVGLPGDSTELQQQEQPESTQTGAAQLAGSEADRPAIDSVFFENKEFYAYVFEALDSGRTYYTDDALAVRANP